VCRRTSPAFPGYAKTAERFCFSPHEPRANAEEAKRGELSREEHGLSVKNAG
jgi:hypothetical protein